jgi:Protein of unknown function (DUF2867)/SnoaL-like domain
VGSDPVAEAHSILQALQEAVDARDEERLVSLFDASAVLVGAGADARTSEAIRDYLHAVATQPGSSRWEWQEVVPFHAEPGSIGFAAFGEIVVNDAGCERRAPFRATLLAVESAEGWRLRQFHGSVPSDLSQVETPGLAPAHRARPRQRHRGALRRDRVDKIRLPNSAHESRRWRVAEITPDFRIEDVWALPARGGAEDSEALFAVMASLDPAHGASAATRLLFSTRYRLGGWFGWDDASREHAIPDKAETTLSARLPRDLCNTATNLGRTSSGFRPLYRTDLEWAAELSNRTGHAVLHLAWVDKGEGRYQGQMAVYVKPRGRLGAAYMALIRPFRHRVVYPALMRQIELAWNDKMAQRNE